MDLFFIMDVSGSVKLSTIGFMKSLLKNLGNRLNLGVTRTSIFTFQNTANRVLPLAANDIATFNGAVDSIPSSGSGGSAGFADAIYNVISEQRR